MAPTEAWQCASDVCSDSRFSCDGNGYTLVVCQGRWFSGFGDCDEDDIANAGFWRDDFGQANCADTA